MQCTEIERELVNYYYGEVEDTLKLTIIAHLQACPRCQREWQEINRTLDKIKRPPLFLKVLEGDYMEGVYRKIRRKRKKGLLLRLAPILAPVVVMLSLVGTLYLQKVRLETNLINKEYELIENLELLQDIDVIKSLEELETMEKG